MVWGTDIVLTSGETTSTIYPGNIVVLDTSNANKMLLSTTSTQSTVIGVAQQTIAPGMNGRVRIFGKTSISINGDVFIGDLLVSSHDGKAQRWSSPPAGSILGISLYSYGWGSGTWVTKSSLPESASDIASVKIGNKIYVVCSKSVVTQIYDINTDTWSTASTSPYRTAIDIAADNNGSIYLPGGADNLGNSTNTNFVYDPNADTWSTASPMPDARHQMAVVTNKSGSIHCIGGYKYPDEVLQNDQNWVYDPNADTWSTASPMPTARRGLMEHGIVANNGSIYVMGGVSGSGAGTSLSTNEVYDPSTDSWSTASTSPYPIGVEGRLGIADNGTIYCIMTTGTVQAYDPSADTWSTASPMPTPRERFTVASNSSSIHVMGGMIDTTSTNIHEAFTKFVEGSTQALIYRM